MSVDERKPVDFRRSVGQLPDGGRRRSKITAEHSNDAFHHPLECHETGRPAVFVDHDRLMCAVPAHLPEQLVGFHRFGHRQRLSRERGDVEVRLRRCRARGRDRAPA